MRCQKCNGDNEPGSRFCGFCGQPLPASLTAEPATAVRDGWTWDNQQSRAPKQPLPAAGPPPPSERKPRTDATGLATTRWLCAAVTLDPELERRVLDEVLEEQQRAVVTTPGVDMVTVLKYALAAIPS